MATCSTVYDDAFGEIRSSQRKCLINPYRFIGQQLGYGFDPDTVQYYLRACAYYRPDLAPVFVG